jgi:hypothetical protein
VTKIRVSDDGSRIFFRTREDDAFTAVYSFRPDFVLSNVYRPSAA